MSWASPTWGLVFYWINFQTGWWVEPTRQWWQYLWSAADWCRDYILMYLAVRTWRFRNCKCLPLERLISKLAVGLNCLVGTILLHNLSAKLREYTNTKDIFRMHLTFSFSIFVRIILNLLDEKRWWMLDDSTFGYLLRYLCRLGFGNCQQMLRAMLLWIVHGKSSRAMPMWRMQGAQAFCKRKKILRASCYAMFQLCLRPTCQTITQFNTMGIPRFLAEPTLAGLSAVHWLWRYHRCRMADKRNWLVSWREEKGSQYCTQSIQSINQFCPSKKNVS